MPVRNAAGWNIVSLFTVFCCESFPLLSFPSLSLPVFAALLTVSEEVRSRCSLKHRKSLLLTDVSMENVPMDTYPIHHSDTSYRLVVSLLDQLPTLQSLVPVVSELSPTGSAEAVGCGGS